MATALDSLCSQAYGSSRLPDVGLYLIRGTILIHLVAVLPVGILWLSSQPVIDALVPDAELATHASSFLWWTLIGVPGYVVFENGKRFMQAQGNFTAGLVVLLICLPINVGLTYFLAVVVDMRVAGAALSSSITNLLRPLLLAAYAMFVKRSTLKCWPTAAEIAAGWWTEWGTILKLAVPGAMMTLSEWLCFEILTFCVSYVSTEALAAQSFLATVATLIWHIPFSASIACSTRVGQLVGAGRTDSTSRVMKWYALVFIVTGLLDCVLGLGLVYGMLRTIVHDARVARIIKATLPAFTFFVFFDAMANWPHAIVRGYGWQYIGAWCTVTINYLYAVPLSMFLELGPPLMGIGGLWAGLGSALALTTISEAVAIWIKLGKAEEQAREVADAEDDGE
jgi:MATE family multidrug resistance protein